MTSSKTCFKCGETKPTNEFYKHAEMADGYLNKCKSCTKSDVAKHRSENLDKVREYDRNRSKEQHRIDKATDITKLWRQADKRRSRAHNAVARAVKKGVLIPQPCQICGSIDVVAHHEDYDKPLDVNWLCQAHHVAHHHKPLF